MKKTVLAVCAMLLLMGTSVSIAGMGGGGMMEESGSSSGGMMSGHEGMSQEGMMQGGMMNHDMMMNDMMDMTEHMSGMMGRMSGMMKDMSKEDMSKMGDLMDEARVQMEDMSRMMRKGTGTEKEMQIMKDRQKEMDEIMKQMEAE